MENYLSGQNNRMSFPVLQRQKQLEILRQENLVEGNIMGQLMLELDRIKADEKKNAETEPFILMFNKKPEQAINEYIKNKFIQEDTPEAIAKYIIKMDGLDKQALGQYFGKNDKKVLAILHAYCKLFNFKGQQFDKALRVLMSKFQLPGQSQQIQRVIWQFALSYYQDNTEIYKNADELFPLAYSIIMLHTDAHNPKQQNKMTEQQFVKNTQGACPSVLPEMLKEIYNRITHEKFQTESPYICTVYGRLKDLRVTNIHEASDLIKQLTKGDIFLKSCRSSNKFVQRKVFLSEDQQKIQWVADPPKGGEQPRFLFIRDITDVLVGLGSEVMKKNKVPAEFDSLCFTIITTSRTLDLKARTTKQRAKWINYLRAILLQRRKARIQQMQQDYLTKFNIDSIEDIWNNDIFPFWDKYWDYKLRKPKEKGYIARGLEAICSCWNQKKTETIVEKSANSGVNIKSGNFLQNLWKYGLPPASRKTLWPLVIGNNLALTSMLIEDIKKRKRKIQELQQFQMEEDIVDFAEMIITMRPDIPPVRDLLLLTKTFMSAFPKEEQSQGVSSLANWLHTQYFLGFYRAEKGQVQLRIQLFQNLLQTNAPLVKAHFKGIRLQTRMYLVGWFLSAFSSCFQGQFLLRIFDNFILQGELYLFKVGITIIKYFETELKMCTFNQGLKLLKFPKDMSSVLFFHILEQQIDVKQHYYQQYIEKRKHAVIKTKVQSIPLQ